MRHTKSTFADLAVALDNNEYIDCLFTRCEIVFSATGPTFLSGCTFDHCRWRFAGAAELTIQLLQAMYGAGGGMRELIENTLSQIRQPRESPKPTAVP